eukprot:Gb_23076 [translate_table: standard]
MSLLDAAVGINIRQSVILFIHKLNLLISVLILLIAFTVSWINHRSNAGLPPGKIHPLPIKNYGSLKASHHYMDDCVICRNSLQNQDNVRLLPTCKHYFHVHCIDMWLRRRANCPICRAGVNVNNL